MGDVIFMAATLAFFAICVLYVKWCDRIIGPDDFLEPINGTMEEATATDATEHTAALAEVRR